MDRIGQITKEDQDFLIKPKQEQQQQSDMVIDKDTAGIFIDTAFELMLQSAGIITVVFTGIATEFGIESSAREVLAEAFIP